MAKTTVHDKDGGIANGDPVVAVAIFEGRGSDAVTLGTGFGDRGRLVSELQFAAETGSRTRHITEGNAKVLMGCDSIDVFTIDSTVEVNND